MKNNGDKRRQPPESKFYDSIKGERVNIVLSRDGSELTATLLWVDRYTLGLRVEDRERLINKSSIETIEPLTRKRHDHSGAAPR